ncbi:MAG: bifunctional salicylyl-CoA 5-hydroxylase/oxidoreductase, partial [Gemmatimonadetes bacterium]|nr:bifunctional salicylyl-CoA 5-hydroxylase/oxidoreductase [Gemmatimonadota bacterium]
TWAAAGMDRASEDETVRFLSELFADELAGAPLVRNRSLWRQFPTVRNARWSAGNVVLIGDAAHTAHFSVGSGTRLAMLDGIALVEALDGESSVGRALERYEEERRPPVASLQRAAQASLQWFEDVERYWHLEPVQFAFSLLSRSLRISHSNLKERDPGFVAQVDRWVVEQAEKQSGTTVAELERSLGVQRPGREAPPPMFTPFRLRDLVLPNRVGVSAMCQYSCEDGLPDEWHLVHLGSRGIGGAGLIMAEMTAVSRDGRISPGCAGLYCDAHVGPWRRVVDFVHDTSWSKIGIQLGHAGRKGATMLDWEGSNEPLPDDGWPIKSASPIPYFEHSPVPSELTRDEMLAVIADFRQATERALEAGFDMVEVHMAHGYLLASFLSPLTNQREDDYGGSLEKRVRFPAEVLRAVREVWPDERPVSVRISAVDWFPGGNGPEEAVAISQALRKAGCDIVDVSAGQTVPDQRPVYGRQFQTPFADRIRNETGLATMAVGNISSPEDVNSIIAAGRADLCLLARAHLWDPYWTLHAAKALGYPLPWPKPYSTLNEYTPRIVS